MGMKEAFETFFEEMDRDSLATFGKLPRIPYIENYVSKELLLLDTLDEDGYAVWRPQLQEKKFSFESVEEEVGFKIHPQIKEFLILIIFENLRQ